MLNKSVNLQLQSSDFHHIADEIIPMVKTLISACEAQGFYIKIVNRATIIRKYLMEELEFDFIAAAEASEHLTLSYHNPGLAFGVAIYESTPFLELKYVDHDIFYERVAKIGESIGFTWAGRQNSLKGLRYFEFKPHWAKHLDNNEMINELYHRKQHHNSLLSTLENN